MSSLTAPITVYTSPGCKPCERVKQMLEDAGVEYDAVNLMTKENEDAYVYVTEVLHVRSTPVVVTDTHNPIVGYQPDKIKELIEYYSSSETGV
ncbi:NrdH-redoxin [Mycobacterium sp. Root265]|uniref:glutaredoxin domain-containing protein n=1 Tax=Mycobacterium sp. Root265 TaxID=1736504 RepID=UPI00070FBD3C|nr:glutaredoxin domain-containing protein [Mycobacterium sp. Root265]KRD08617.1 NrdH-redoxin [Mycobacterium sp. Root265]